MTRLPWGWLTRTSIRTPSCFVGCGWITWGRQSQHPGHRRTQNNYSGLPVCNSVNKWLFLSASLSYFYTRKHEYEYELAQGFPMSLCYPSTFEQLRGTWYCWNVNDCIKHLCRTECITNCLVCKRWHLEKNNLKLNMDAALNPVSQWSSNIHILPSDTLEDLQRDKY